MRLEEADPKGLVRESYRIEGISLGECRSIFMDWALSVADNRKIPDALRTLIAEYCTTAPDHPMNEVLTAGLMPAAEPKRRGGRLGRSA
ncbi:hypothetical protein [Paracoccus sp. IB05]|uniref:hypothetical protein n=1 Tax=Paracoccus sp. IB05 TaxID=2779367 RepID=UPI0018E85A5C|nr:hypothetical protein [Paracoccus sp. IB05]